VRRENRPCEGGIAGPRVNWKPNWNLSREVCSVKILHPSLFTMPLSDCRVAPTPGRRRSYTKRCEHEPQVAPCPVTRRNQDLAR
jgi:hypothetical protein